MFSDFQYKLNSSWNEWRKKKKQLTPLRQRKGKFCPHCNKQFFKVKLDYLGNKRFLSKGARYNVDFFKCPRCGFVDKVFSRIEGKGTTGVDISKDYGSK